MELSQDALGHLIGISREQVSSIELGHSRTLLHHARAIEGVFMERNLGRGSTFDRSGQPVWTG